MGHSTNYNTINAANNYVVYDLADTSFDNIKARLDNVDYWQCESLIPVAKYGKKVIKVKYFNCDTKQNDFTTITLIPIVESGNYEYCYLDYQIFIDNCEISIGECKKDNFFNNISEYIPIKNKSIIKKIRKCIVKNVLWLENEYLKICQDIGKQEYYSIKTMTRQEAIKNISKIN